MISILNKTWVRITFFVILTFLLLIVALEAVYLNRTYSDEDMKHAIAKVEHQTGYAIVADGKEVMYFTELAEDSLFVGLDTLQAPVLRSYFSRGAWVNAFSFIPSCEGTLVAHDYAPNVDSLAKAYTHDADTILRLNINSLLRNVSHIDAIKKEVDYYLSVHSMVDGEYGSVVDYSANRKAERILNMKYVELLDTISKAKKIEIRPISKYLVSAYGRTNVKNVQCQVLPFVGEDEECVSNLQYRKMTPGTVILQLESLLLPENACAVSYPAFTEFEYQMTDSVYIPKFTKKKIQKQPLQDARAYIPMFGADNRFLGFTPEACHHRGEADTLGYKLIGKCDVDSLIKGTFTDSLGTYIGQMTFDGTPNGVGEFNYADGSHYEGDWLGGKRHGSGFLASPTHMVKAGEWKDDAYKGERMVYNANRVYGIDISRYQHEIGRKKYNIDWKNLRITYLGAKNSGDAADSIDYPVSFVYIKSTQGTSIKSKYYLADARAARSHGIKCGAYHFYSVKTNALAQAKYFLKNTQVLSSDLPPVLDVEPTDREIAKGGGEQKLFESIRIWMKTVESKTGKRPILYVSQKFIQKHLSKAPDICNNYEVWIARYGAYRPELKLLFWQLTPFGRVRGIRGDVDINVFNGHKEEFEKI